MTDPYRHIARAGLFPLVEELPEPPAWEDLGVGRTRLGIAAPPRRGGSWLTAAIVAVVVAIIGATALLSRTDPTTGGPGDVPFDVAAAVDAGEAWWNAVIRGDIGGAAEIAHPEADFSYDVITDELVASLGEVVTVTVSSDPFRGPPQWELCFAVEGTRATYSGSMVYREHEGRWLPWEQRQGTERCGDGDPRSTTTMPAPETAPTRDAIVSPLPVDEPIPLRILAVRPNNPSLAVLDLEAGTTTLYPPGAHALPGDAVDGAVMTPLRHLVVWTQGVARLFTGALDTIDREFKPDPLREIAGFSTGARVVPTPDGQRVWLVQTGIVYGTNDYPTVAELVEIATGRSLQRFEIDGRTFPAAATDTGLVLDWARLVDTGDGWTDEPGSHQVMLLRETGELLTVGAGHTVAATSDTIIRHTCPVRGGAEECDLLISDTDGLSERLVAKPEAVSWTGGVGGPGIPSDAMPMSVISPNGTWLLEAFVTSVDANGYPLRSTLVAVALETGEMRTIREFDGPIGLATWSADGRWIAQFQFNDVFLIDALNPERTILLEDVIPADHFVLAAG